MSLPYEFSNPALYFQECMDFLHKYKWIFSSSNTRFLKERVLDSFPSDWQRYFIGVANNDLNNFPDGLNNQEIMPESLQIFQSKLQSLRPLTSLPCIVNTKLMKGMSPKKSHEILRLAKLIADSLDDDEHILVDFGSGLGYLSEVLYKMTNCKILGLECSPDRVALAKQRQINYYPDSIANVVYETLNITPDSGDQILDLCRKHFAAATLRNNLTIIGLHACGDLSIAAIQLFLHLECVQKLIIMPCCYHKLELSTNFESLKIFNNFPISLCLSKVVEKSKRGFEILNRPYLRLACQQTVSRWRYMQEENHQKHGLEMFARAVVECLPEEDQIVTRNKGKKQKLTNITFENLSKQYSLKRNVEIYNHIDWSEKHRKHVNELLTKYPNGTKLCEALTCLQTALQELCENIVLLDRIYYVEESALSRDFNISAEVKKILNDELSPRCFAFIAEKHKRHIRMQ